MDAQCRVRYAVGTAALRQHLLDAPFGTHHFQLVVVVEYGLFPVIEIFRNRLRFHGVELLRQDEQRKLACQFVSGKFDAHPGLLQRYGCLRHGGIGLAQFHLWRIACLEALFGGQRLLGEVFDLLLPLGHLQFVRVAS